MPAVNSSTVATLADEANVVLTGDLVRDSLRRSHLLYDRSGDQHYNCISAFQKSIRGGNASAALYWLARMLEGGEDPLYVARRLVRTASEDIGESFCWLPCHPPAPPPPLSSSCLCACLLYFPVLKEPLNCYCVLALSMATGGAEILLCDHNWFLLLCVLRTW